MECQVLCAVKFAASGPSVRNVSGATSTGAALRRSDGGTATDFQTPWLLKVISSAPLSRNLSYYFYFMISERGETGAIEDAFVLWNDIGGRPVDLAVGQFQVSDPLFKRELRLMNEDYAIYRAHIGETAGSGGD